MFNNFSNLKTDLHKKSGKKETKTRQNENNWTTALKPTLLSEIVLKLVVREKRLRTDFLHAEQNQLRVWFYMKKALITNDKIFHLLEHRLQLNEHTKMYFWNFWFHELRIWNFKFTGLWWKQKKINNSINVFFSTLCTRLIHNSHNGIIFCIELNPCCVIFLVL